jgi:flavorubredoxin
LQAVVLDEVDVLLGGVHAFEEEMMPIVERVTDSMQLVLASATLPEPVYERLRELFPDLRAATGPNLHHIASGAISWPVRRCVMSLHASKYGSAVITHCWVAE